MAGVFAVRIRRVRTMSAGFSSDPDEQFPRSHPLVGLALQSGSALDTLLSMLGLYEQRRIHLLVLPGAHLLREAVLLRDQDI